MNLNRRDGYTLLELIVACLLVMIVLYGLYSTISSMARFQVEAVRKGGVNGWSNTSLSVMTKEIESADAIIAPTSAGGNTMMGCANWSTRGGSDGSGAIDPTLPVTWFQYCYDSATGPNAPGGSVIPVLRRIASTGTSVSCSGAAMVACTDTAKLGAAGTQTNDIIALNVTGPAVVAGKIFTFTSDGTAINVNFVVGSNAPSTPGTAPTAPSNAYITNPQTSTVNTSVQISRNYLNSND
jgi:type II secretory pathway pseudopilin PulG